MTNCRPSSVSSIGGTSARSILTTHRTADLVYKSPSLTFDF
jgi:hypothetical protein